MRRDGDTGEADGKAEVKARPTFGPVWWIWASFRGNVVGEGEPASVRALTSKTRLEETATTRPRLTALAPLLQEIGSPLQNASLRSPSPPDRRHRLRHARVPLKVPRPPAQHHGAMSE